MARHFGGVDSVMSRRPVWLNQDGRIECAIAVGDDGIARGGCLERVERQPRAVQFF